MKIGIITLTGSDNYGNILQNYAVQKTLEKFGCVAETIPNTTTYGFYKKRDKVFKLSPSYIKKYICNRLNYRLNIKNTGDGFLRLIYYYIKNKNEIENAKKLRKSAFDDFIQKNIKKSEFKINVNNVPIDLKDEYDYFVCGSDQIWNPTYPTTSMIDFLQFAPENKRIAFSPSFGIDSIPEELKDDCRKWIASIPHLSVREEQGRKIINDLCGKDCKVLVDPTMVLSAKEWESIEKKPAFLGNDEYILTYFLGNKSKKYNKYISSLAKKKNLKVINLFDIKDLEPYSADPGEFVYLIHNAKLVCTDSFHGTVFSIIFKKDFLTFTRVESGKSMNSRIDTLLETFNLQQRHYTKTSLENVFSVNYHNADEILLQKRNEVFEFLNSAFSSNMINKPLEFKPYGEKNQCFGCGACEQACPKNAITMQEDDEGFLYPYVEEKDCIHCNNCLNICPVNHKNNNRSVRQCFAAYTNDKDSKMSSSSGGIFAELAKLVTENGGVVFGAGYDNDFNVLCTEADEVSHIKKLQGSKYVQSAIGDKYKRVRSLLQENRFVYFSGTPCQIKGLYSYLGNKEYDNLITQDLICHGVPSPLVWKKYVEFMRRGRKIENISFRNKKYGWRYFSMFFKYKSNSYVKRLDEDNYLRLFLDNTILRPICYDCPVKKEVSLADITLADFWGSKKYLKKLKDDDTGISLVFVNTKKGKDFWDELNTLGRVSVEVLDTEEAAVSQEAIKKSAAMNQRRHLFFDMLKKENFDYIIKNWYSDSAVRILKKKYIYFKTKVYSKIMNRKGR